MPQDNTLAETLGGIGSALGGLMDPKRRLEAQMLRQRMMLEQYELYTKEKQEAARMQAKVDWSHVVPPNKMGEIERMIETGASYRDVARAAAQLSGHLIDSLDPEATKRNIRYVEEVTGEPWKEAYNPVAGPITAKARLDTETAQKGAGAGAEEAARIAAQQAGRADLSTLEDTPWDAAALRRNNDKWLKAKGEPPPDNIAPAGPATEVYRRQIKLGMDEASAAATARGTLVGGGTTDRKVVPEAGSLPPLPGAPGATQGAPPVPVPAGTPPAPPAAATPPAATPPAAAPPGAPPAGGATTITAPSAVGPNYIPPATVSQSIPGVGVSVGGGFNPEDVKAGAGIGADRKVTLQSALADRETAYDLMNKTRQLRGYISIINASDASGQIEVNLLKKINDLFGINAGSVAEARTAANQLFQTELPALRSVYKFRTYAGPELSAAKQSIGTAEMPTATVMNILANEDQTAQMQIARGNDAQKVLEGRPGEMMWDTYREADTKRLADSQARTDELRKLYGATPSEQQQPQSSFPTGPKPVPAAAPVMTSGQQPWTSFDSWLTGSGGLSAGAMPAAPAEPAPAPALAPARPPVYRAAPNGDLILKQ
jgi:hypothetical protein